jgi:hypothetical protein
MKQRSRTNLRQTELFPEPGSSSVAIPLPLAVSREAELKRALAKLLLDVALADVGVPKGENGETGNEYDE